MLDNAVTVVIVVNTGLVVSESYWNCTQQIAPPWAETCETMMSLIYVVDVLLRLSVTSWGTYWSSGGNQFDFIISWTLFLAGACTLFDSGSDFRYLLTYLAAFRILRICRVIRQIERFKTLAACLGNLWLLSGDLMLMLGVTSLGFAMLGCTMFGGELYSHNPKLKDSDWLKGGYALWNFNDMSGALMTVFIMFVNTYMPVYVDACNLVSAVPLAGTVYGIAVFFVGVNMGFNIVSSFTIDVFVSLRDRSTHDESEEAANLRHMRQNLREQGQVLHIMVPRALRRLKALAGVINGLEDAIQEARDEVLKNFVMGPQASESDPVVIWEPTLRTHREKRHSENESDGTAVLRSKVASLEAEVEELRTYRARAEDERRTREEADQVRLEEERRRVKVVQTTPSGRRSPVSPSSSILAGRLTRL
mmetsp:Transcript_132106/g.423202  ORF Transcript_132106/g.423202 Transcript_132106/m.423202 type:complete len:420 (+) Transcript_132106:596-1855(+)